MDAAKARAAMKDMAKRLARLGVADEIALGLPLRLTASSWLFEAEQGGAPVILKRVLGDGAADTVHGMQAELDRVSEIFGDGDCRANRCLQAWPEEGLILLSHAPGVRLSDAIAAAAPENRARLLQHAGRWLHRLTDARVREIGFGPRKWLQKLADPQALPLRPVDRGRLARLRASLTAQAPRLRGLPVRQAATHGDYVGINCHYHDGAIYGLDMQGEVWLAVARDVARFLVWQTLHDHAPAGPTRAGLRGEDVGAFLSSGVLPDTEQSTVLPFFIGVDLHRRFTEAPADAAHLVRARAAIDAYLNEYPGG